MDGARFKVYRAAVAAKLRRLIAGRVDPYAPLPAGTRLSPSLGIAHALERAPTRLSWSKANVDEPLAWRDAARGKLVEITGYRTRREAPGITHAAPEVALGEGLIRRSLYLRVRPDTDLPVHLIHREGAREPMPVFLHLAGSTSGVHLAWGDARVPIDHQRLAIGADMARQAARRGYLGVAIEQIGYGERGERFLRRPSADRTIDAANHLLLLGRTLMGDGATDVSHALDHILAPGHAPAVDPDRVFLFGHSAGGTLAQYAAALDDRITGVLASGSVGPLRETIAARGAAGGDGIVPGFLTWFDSADLVAMVAPRRFVGLSGTRDHIFPASGVAAVVEEARAYYDCLGVADRVHAAAVEGGHRYYADATWAAWDAHIDPDR
jgi:pimeloyl-ACP methyl ester carboxylesterase